MKIVWVILLNVFLGCQFLQPKVEPADPEELAISEMSEKVSLLISEDYASEVDDTEDKSQLTYEVRKFIGNKLVIVKISDTNKDTEYQLEVTVKARDGRNKSIEKIVIKENDAERLIKKMEVALRQIL